MAFNLNFRKKNLQEKWDYLKKEYQIPPDVFSQLFKKENLLDLALKATENAIGFLGIPVGLAHSFVINNKEYLIPLATEEASVVLACSYMALLIKKGGGLLAKSSESFMIGQVFWKGFIDKTFFFSSEEKLLQFLEPFLLKMKKRGGGYRGFEIFYDEKLNITEYRIKLDVVDAQGASFINLICQKVKEFYEKNKNQHHFLMSILSNQANDRLFSASFSLPIKYLKRDSYNSFETAKNIVLASRISHRNSARAVTNNKGIMNGINALALVTGNDTRAQESAFHAYACQNGFYQGLGNYKIEDDKLIGEIKLPIVLGTKSYFSQKNYFSQIALKILDVQSAKELGKVAASLALVQNCAALFSLVTDGIHKTHQDLHHRKLE